MNDFERLLARYGGAMSWQLFEGKPWSECSRMLSGKDKTAAQKIKVEFVDKQRDDFREDEQGWEGSIWAVYKHDGKYYQIDGSIDSYGRDRYLGFYEVEGEEVKVTRFRPKS